MPGRRLIETFVALDAGAPTRRERRRGGRL